MESSPELLQLARNRFSHRKLSVAEERIFTAAASGNLASLTSGNESEDDPANAENWTADRTVRAECIVWLCTDQKASSLVSHHGIHVTNVRVDGELALLYANVSFPLAFSKSVFDSIIWMMDTRLPLLALEGSRIVGLNADRLTVGGSIMLRSGFRSDGEVRLAGVRIGGNLECDNSKLLGFPAHALIMDGAQIDGNVFLRAGFEADGEVRLPAARIRGHLSCSGAKFKNTNGKSLNAQGATIDGSVFLSEGFESKGEVSITGASIGRTLDCHGAHFVNSGGCALTADAIRVEGSVIFRDGFSSEGEVVLRGATIRRNFECDGARFRNENARALDATGAEIHGNVFIRKGCSAEGQLIFVGVWIRGGLQAHGIETKSMLLDLRSATVDEFWDDEKSWPAKGKLLLDGFRYNRFFQDAPLEVPKRIEWLKRQPRNKFLPQPYEQLASVLRVMGHERDARYIMIEKNREQARFTLRFRQGWWWYNFVGRAIGYGYAPWRALAASVVMILIGLVFFWVGLTEGLISPTKESAYEKSTNGQFVIVNGKRKISDDYPAFNPFAFSVESFIPLLKLDQRDNWAPNPNSGVQYFICRWPVITSGGVLRTFLWTHTIIGWILTTLWIGAVTGLVKS